MSLSENLYNLGALMKTNLEKKGITGLTGNEGLTTLANKILDIECNDLPKNLVANFTGNSISIGSRGGTWLTSTGNVMIDWGDGTSDIVNNPSRTLSHTYTDGVNEHLIIFYGTVTSLGDDCFSNCSGLTSIIIPDSITSLGYKCFYECSGLTSITIPSSLMSLGQECFYNCSSLTSIVIPDYVTSLETGCFYGCTGLTSITIPNTVTSLGDNCFSNCSSLTSIIIPDSVISLGENCFLLCTGLTNVTIPDSVTSLGRYCFYGCTGLTSVIIPDSVTSIEDECFLACTNLVNYELYWETQPVTYDSMKMIVNNDTFFTIPFDTALIYDDAGYPLDRLIERESS